MDVLEMIKDAIGNLGFPIACVVAMFWQMEKERAAHKEESEKWVAALDRNTAVIEKVVEKLNG